MSSPVPASFDPKDPGQLKTLAEQVLSDDKAEDIEVIDLQGRTALADYIIVASGRSSRQVAALAEKLYERFKAVGAPLPRIEGLAQCNWVIVDVGDVIIHIFRPEVREFYHIEDMWRSSSVETISAA